MTFRSRHFRMTIFVVRYSLVLAITGLCGCVTPMNTRFPELFNRGGEYERREAQIQDPYPDSQLAPDTGSRPRGYAEQRSEARSIREKNASVFLRGRSPQLQNPLNSPLSYVETLPAF